MNTPPVALVTGSAQRIGACIVDTLHREGYRLLIHYRRSAAAATALADRLNQQRDNSARTCQGDLADTETLIPSVQDALDHWGRLDLLVNNASDFYPTPLGAVTDDDWDALMASNLRGPFFLSQALAPMLARHRGSIVNLVDTHATHPLAAHSVYCMAKAALAMQTRSLALELAPDVRVNGIAPGAILWPEHDDVDTRDAEALVRRIPLQRTGTPEDIARTVVFLAHSPYVTGQILAVDGGRSLRPGD